MSLLEGIVMRECQQCKGTGSIRVVLRDKGGKSNDSIGESHLVVCPHPSCRDGYVDEELSKKYHAWTRGESCCY